VTTTGAAARSPLGLRSYRDQERAQPECCWDAGEDAAVHLVRSALPPIEPRSLPALDRRSPTLGAAHGDNRSRSAHLVAEGHPSSDRRCDVAWSWMRDAVGAAERAADRRRRVDAQSVGSISPTGSIPRESDRRKATGSQSLCSEFGPNRSCRRAVPFRNGRATTEGARSRWRS
jgi:hypothetical protein